MATKSKQGLDYFPFDVNFLSESRVRRVIKTHGSPSFSVLTKLMINIYKFEGYYMICNDDAVFEIAESLHMEENEVMDIILKSVEVGIFDMDKFKKFNILTSKSIQDNFLFITKRRKGNLTNEEYLIGNEGIEDVAICRHDVNKNRQRKVKEKKVKETEGEERKKKEVMKNKKTSFSYSSKTPPPPPSWRNNFNLYIQDLDKAYNDVLNDNQYLNYKRRLYPDMDVKRTLEKIIIEYWATQNGWKQKKKHPDEFIDWRLTFNQQMSYPYNVINKPKNGKHG